MPIYLLDALYHHVVIGLTHNMEDALVMHIVSIAILITLPIKKKAKTLNSVY